MSNLGRALVAGICCAILAGWSGSASAVDESSAVSRAVDLYYTVIVEDIPVDADDIKAWVPLPQSDVHQDVLGYEIIESYPFRVVSEKEYGNQFLMIDLSQAEDASIEFTVVFHVNRRPVYFGSGYDKDDSMLARYLEADAMIPLNGIIAAEAIATVGDEADTLVQARLLYQHLVSTVEYNKPPGGKHGRGDALFVCDERYGNCTDFHSLFIGEARSLGIPARFQMGIPFSRTESEGEIGGYHCWAEFWVDGLGWVPVDASEASKDKARAAELFGGLDASRVQFITGRDMQIPGSNAGMVNFVIYPHVEADGKGINAGKTFRFSSR